MILFAKLTVITNQPKTFFLFHLFLFLSEHMHYNEHKTNAFFTNTSINKKRKEKCMLSEF